ncbi:hypothetical protein HPB48_004445 [Haemaphysalis longicornis]|uniref:Uncharacterized protein n=1 Tax=Haemaphysalis longicornis TaxID=44386 RepID=A0A9J6FYA2_HAELO|nr:hypothetical protein HPB48_004445 [Haemaphysalis longicornis]
MGYRTHDSPPSARTSGKGAAQGVCTLIRKGLAHTKHQQFLGDRSTAIEMCVTELAFTGKGRSRGSRRGKTSTSLLLANVYSNPRHSGQKFKALFGKVKAARLAAGKEMAKIGNAIAMICGYFNAQHEELGGKGHHSVPVAKDREPEKDWERRKARAAALAKQYKSDENAAFVDVARHPTRRCVYAMAVIRASTGELINAGTIKAKTPCQAEEAAIGLAMGVPDIQDDPQRLQTASGNYARSTSLANLGTSPDRPTITISGSQPTWGTYRTWTTATRMQTQRPENSSGAGTTARASPLVSATNKTLNT